ncbi:MAG: hypothetical protein ABL949_07100 [Fimbriimonadaceae bacterium]
MNAQQLFDDLWMARYAPDMIRRTQYDPGGKEDTPEDFSRQVEELKESMRLILERADDGLLASIGGYLAVQEQKWKTGALPQTTFADILQIALDAIRIVAEHEPGRLKTLVGPFFSHGEGMFAAAALYPPPGEPKADAPIRMFVNEIKNVRFDRTYPTYEEDHEFLFDIEFFSRAAKEYVSCLHDSSAL